MLDYKIINKLNNSVSIKKVVLFLTMPQSDEELDKLYSRIRELAELKNDEEFALVAAFVDRDEWNDVLSPWKFKDERGHKDFAGNGKALLAEIENELLPEIILKLGNKSQMDSVADNKPELIIAGYSLAGLFSLWAMCESEAFAGAVSCSGSMWFPGATDYFEREFSSDEEPEVKLDENLGEKLDKKCVYLSLGTKEEKARDFYMRQVGDATRKIYEVIKNRLGNDVTLEWNPGNHFSDVSERMAKGISWAVKER